MARYRTDLARARGLGAAKHGAGHWLTERITSIALAPLSVWGVFAALRLGGSPDYGSAVDWVQEPINAVLLMVLLFVSFVHMHAGMRVIIEDYIEKTLTKAVLLLINLAVCVLAGTLAIFSILKVALGGVGVF
jgi:succinate dehydrogenase / fumarate reductase membrane anchor subunit